MSTAEVEWPAVIRYAGDDELTFVADRAEWESDADLSGFGYTADDILIDSRGSTFALSALRDGSIVPRRREEVYAAERFAELLQRHFALGGQCCVAKLAPQSIASAMSLLQQDTMS